MQLAGDVTLASGLWARSGPLRSFCRTVITHPHFDHLILACILTGSVLLAVNGPTNDGDTRVWRYVCYVEFAFVIIFISVLLFDAFAEGTVRTLVQGKPFVLTLDGSASPTRGM